MIHFDGETRVARITIRVAFASNLFFLFCIVPNYPCRLWMGCAIMTTEVRMTVAIIGSNTDVSNHHHPHPHPPVWVRSAFPLLAAFSYRHRILPPRINTAEEVVSATVGAQDLREARRFMTPRRPRPLTPQGLHRNVAADILVELEGVECNIRSAAIHAKVPHQLTQRTAVHGGLVDMVGGCE
jgi:hypothetical protein